LDFATDRERSSRGKEEGESHPPPFQPNKQIEKFSAGSSLFPSNCQAKMKRPNKVAPPLLSFLFLFLPFLSAQSVAKISRKSYEAQLYEVSSFLGELCFVLANSLFILILIPPPCAGPSL
jgi:hypothetical protein